MSFAGQMGRSDLATQELSIFYLLSSVGGVSLGVGHYTSRHA